ncbi:MAG TPA: glycosyltransferase family 39 protein [Methylomirabilota bacterium]|jgi:4-amino-4-deoxy-L-arabinose transferase-like glycosyltransferase|nr:glycosyltransferase family 39 protein [Methylomirabilota bacterium]
MRESGEHGPGWPVLCALVLLVSFGFLGSRGLWEPDEGRYVEVAREMMVAGDYLTPTLNRVPHLTKPPLTYWTVATGLALLGRNEWGARLFQGLAFAATALLVACLGERLRGSARGRWAGLVYATMVLPFVAGSLVTADTLLVLGETAALAAFWRGWTADTRPSARRWMIAFWAGLGVAFMAKGPPALLPVLVVMPFSALAGRPRSLAARTVWCRPAGLAMFIALALPWFLLIALTHPGVVDYLVGDEVVGRLATRAHHRNSRWYMGLWIYPLTVALGALPWSLAWPGTLPAAWRRGWWREVVSDPPRFFLASWIAVPIVVLICAPSRLPLYVLPIFPALALATCMAAPNTGLPGPVPRGRGTWRPALVAVSGVGLLGLRLLAGWLPMAQDTRALARWVSPHLTPGAAEVIVVDRRIYGLPFYLDVPLELVARRPERIPEFAPTAEPWEEEIGELRHVRYRHVFVVPRRLLPAFAKRTADESVPCREESAHRDLRLLVCEPPD